MRTTLLSLSALLLANCAAVPHDQPVVAKVAAASVGVGQDTASIDARWWDAFGDAQLGSLIDAGLAANPTLDAALARVRAAQAEIAIRHADQLPQVAADGQATEQRLSDKYLIPPPYAGTTRAVAQVQAGLNWDLDLFGRQRALVAKARSSAEAAQLDADAARLTISTSIAQTYIGLARAERQIQVAQGFVDTRQQSLAYVKSRSRNDLANQIEVRTAETLLAEAEQAKVRAERQRDLLIHALAALAGRGADFYASVTPPALALDTPPAVPAVLPADLLGRRPDLLAAEARIDAAMADRKVARADFLPNVNLQALAGFSAIGLGNLFTSGAGTYGAGAAIHLPIFEAGKLRAQYRQATADLDLAVADYNQGVLQAVRETSDALTGIQAADADLAQQKLVVSGLRDTVRLDQVRVSTGLASKLDAIDSGFRLLEAEQALVDLQADGLVRRVQLVAALGGGFKDKTSEAAASSKDKVS
ncbi:MAG TPA: efflux transporter outer membrane subunit [Sphingomonas sp.]|uniref:efflux transporter outer membrane subunit n=1 Tax=Sphingomonas sp. TaxID=28214 RepID=UPI002D005A92|nr:efflux transporter outer membrane subunit [Sphingomonas sp.]HMI20449.1 efflux transporter outer membrane subunit [Sphingomonas sp.]